MGRDLVSDNGLLPNLALDKLSPTALIALCEEWPSARGCYANGVDSCP
ncbi:hypothetical protein N183_28285 [Sinorhizobium sp. Sb3]|nr:hypothetical protein N183_28285 [Sinorhizobium sp. Sb3]